MYSLTSFGTSARSELGRTSCSRAPRRWSACPRRRIPFFRNRRRYCCTSALVERYFTLEGLASQAASTGRRTGSCCCSCKSAISVGEARWSGPLRLPQCRTAPLHCPSAFRQLFYTVSVPPDSSSTLSQCPQTAPLHCLSAPRQLFYTVSVPPDSSSTLSQCPQTALLHCLSAPRQLLYTVSVPPDSSSTLSQCPQTAPLHCFPVADSSTSSPARQRQV